MIKQTATAIALALALTACGQPTPAAEPEKAPVTAEEMAANGERLNAWFDAKYEEELQFSPIGLTFLGRKDKNDQIDCFTLECHEEQLAWRVAATEEMENEFDYDALSPADRISYDIWKYQTEQEVAGEEYLYNGYIFDQMNGPQGFMPTFLINFHNVETVEDFDALVNRISETGRAMNEAILIARESASRGVHAPKFAYEGVIDQSKKVITGAPFTEGEDSALYADVKSEIAKLSEAGELTEEEADAKLEQARIALVDNFQPAYEAIIAFAEEDMANSPDPDSPVGADTQPNGKDYYNHLLATQTTTDLTADEIHEIGLAEVARIHEEMEAIKQEVGFEGTLQEFFTMLRDSKDDERFYYPNTDEGRQAYIDDATRDIENIKANLPEFFGILPKADLVVKRVEPFREQDGAAQHYYPGTPDGSRSGTYYAHLSDMTAMPKRELEVIAYHEGIPGHHMQISIAQELEGVPQFRTQAGFTAYIEGWALYSEWLATEFPDTYEDPYSNFGRLGSEIWRAIRLVVDTGIHSKGWTEEEAVQYFLNNTAITEMQARSEIQRYIVMPGQATSYKIGMMKIQQLRKKAEDELGDKFDIRAFHDTVLGGGALPLEILERRVDQWIEEVKAA
ncbi:MULTISPECIES: DUF885 domain-containing protein [unclassified Hyphomonas]|jgi:uncharacterized protein (DUF885 family)|uniref:DUF885 domain-containing protein n=1 Tax=unclassified Hyphomonas TaxID=2630699 RepID=UPI000C3C709C|nr:MULTISPECIES: DUF885 domain-containing protein [unclassified Hyphomonas]MAL44793.1 DUF885 domain-containing protein [Hyphomonas sp.]MAX83987.1 DUF885 domain-containing protein [Hyphomonas sp.]HAW56545.1 DUF885 domain-containing protein [Hyphomonas sp.]HBJ41559.1 DUF885 domain-containing protein [Hyphomonas sp.]HBN93551.1 DUF885 domain-containing protein [Hyphomonas sp.]|tara:strand:+ start:11422 stop:13293 length:1872 start_codon:yes stop_codon:yes gene_type:complete